MKTKTLLLIAALAAAVQFHSVAQRNADTAPVASEMAVQKNTAIVPVPRTGGITNRQSLVLQRAKDAPGEYDIEFIGDSITQGWEGARQKRLEGILRQSQGHQHGRQRRPHRARPLAV